MPARKIALMGIMVTLALMLSYIESLIILPVGIPGIKVGLSNLAVVILLYICGPKEAALVNLVRILLASLLFGTGMSLVFSLAGGLLSFMIMAVSQRTSFFTPLGVSLLGGVFHNIAQLFAAALFFSSAVLIWYLPALLFSGIIAGSVVGFFAGILIKRIRPFYEKGVAIENETI